MPYIRLALEPGIIKDDAPVFAKGRITDGKNIRFRRNAANMPSLPEVVGGWESLTTDTFTGIARGAHAWTDLIGLPYFAWGTESKLYAYAGGEIVDITPKHSEGVMTDPFSTVSGSPTVTVTHADHALKTGQTVTYEHATAVGGITISGAYTVTTVTDRDTYTITHGSNASSTAGPGGGQVDYAADLTTGLTDGIGGLGYGVGEYGEGPYGGASVSESQPRVWSLDNFGQSLLAVPRGGGLYQWFPHTIYSELVRNGDFASSANWTLGAGWSITGGQLAASAGSASNAYQTIPELIPGQFYRVVFTVSGRTAGTVAVKASDGGSALTFGDASGTISTNGTFSRLVRLPGGTDGILFEKDASFDGDIDDVSILPMDKATRVDEAPSFIDTMFVDPNRIVVLVGTEHYGGVYNPLLVRWSDMEDVTDWTPSTQNLAGELPLSKGGRAIAGRVTRQQNLIWTDDAVYTMQFLGNATDVYSIRLAGTGCGLIGANAAVDHNGAVVWMSRTNFHMFNGSAPTTLPCSVRREVFENIAQYQEEKVFAGVNSAFDEAWFFYPDARDGLECSRQVILGLKDGDFSLGDIARTAWIKPGVYPHPIAFPTDGRIYFHEKGRSADGGAISAYLETAYFEAGEGDSLVYLDEIVPEFEDQAGPVMFTIKTRAFANASDLSSATYTANPSTQVMQMHLEGRLVKVRMESTAAPSFWRLGAVKFDVRPSGSRR